MGNPPRPRSNQVLSARAPPQRVITEGGGDAAVVGRCGHAVEAVPCEDGSPAVAHALGHVAVFVVAVAGAGVVLQQVVQQLAGWVPQGIVGHPRGGILPTGPIEKIPSRAIDATRIRKLDLKVLRRLLEIQRH